MIAPLRYVISLHKRSILTVVAIAVVVMFLTSITVVIYSFEMSNRALVERFQTDYYVISSTEDLLKSRVPEELVGNKGAYVTILNARINNVSTYIVGIYDPGNILGKRYQCSAGEIILGKYYSNKLIAVHVAWRNGSEVLKVKRITNLNFFPQYWAVANFSFVKNQTHRVNFIITKGKINVQGYEIYSMTKLNDFYVKNIGEITWDLFFLEAISIVVIYIFTNTLLNMEIRENVRKIGIMKAVGSSKKNIAALYLLRSIFVGSAGMLLGFSLGVILSYLLISFIPLLGLSTYFFIYIPPMVFLIDLLIAIAGAAIAAVGPIRRAVRIDILRGMRGAMI